jgi:hypothetical protein
MAKRGATRGAAQVEYVALPPRGSVRGCMTYRDELVRHRVISADGHDIAVATVTPHEGCAEYVTTACPVQQGYLVMVRQPICELHSASADAASDLHERLVRVLAEAGAGVVRARRTLAARRRAEGREVQELGTFMLATELPGADASMAAASL